METIFASTTRRIPRTGKRRICFPITSRAYYGRSQLLIRKLHAHPEIELELMLGGSILLDKYSRHIADDINAGGFNISTTLFNVIEGGNHVAMAKTACLTALEFTNGFHAADPDVIVICGDRFEQLALAMAAAYLNKTIAHIEGGDVSGSIDESVRHAITKLAHMHFVTNEHARRRVLAMGEDPKYVFNTGSLDVELAAQVTTSITSERINGYGVGQAIDVAKPFLLVIQHPVTTEHDNRAHVEETLRAIADLDMQTIWIWPNPDAGTGEIADRLRHFREQAGRQDALHHRRPGRRVRGAAENRVVPRRQLVGGHQGVLVPRHAGREHRRAAAGAASRGKRDPRRVRRRSDRRSRSPADGPRAVRALGHLLQARRERRDRQRPLRRGAVYAEAVSRDSRDDRVRRSLA